MYPRVRKDRKTKQHNKMSFYFSWQGIPALLWLYQLPDPEKQWIGEHSTQEKSQGQGGVCVIVLTALFFFFLQQLDLH